MGELNYCLIIVNSCIHSLCKEYLEPGTHSELDPGQVVQTEEWTTQTKASAFCGGHFPVDCSLITFEDDGGLSELKHWMPKHGNKTS